MENIISSIIGKIAEFTVEPIGRELGYPCFMSSNIEKLKSQVETLKERRDLVQHMVDVATRNVEDIKPAVVKWLGEVDDIIKRSEGIVNESRQVRLCSNLVQRRNLSKKAKKMAEELTKMEEKARDFNNGVSYNARLPLGNSYAKVPDFLDFESRNSIMEQIMDAILDNSVNMIGVYGMGGVGKTMLVKELSRIIMEKKSLHRVITATVSQTPDFKIIQRQLADMLNLELKQETVQGRALVLCKRLKMEKSILMVLDDIWEHIDLETIGIPSVADHTGCKILFTSRDKHVLSNEMGINRIFEIKVLEEDESWNLFKKIVGEIVETSSLKPIAIQIVKECAHLPIAITTVAKALRNQSPPIWNDALNKLKNPVAVNIIEMDKKVYSSLKLSYDYLQDKEAKLLFLLCSMFPEDYVIEVEDLHVYAMSMGFLHGVDTVVQGRYRIKKLVYDLISSSLLLQFEEGYKGTCVKMHDLVRDVAIIIASTNDQIRTLSYVQRLKEWEEEKVSGNHTAVYLNIKGLKSSHQKLMLPKVQLFMLRGSLSNGHELVETFFEEMKELKGLELNELKVSLSLPSLYSFANVRLLHLINCELGNIDMIGELRKLEILSFERSNIVEIPMTIGQLTQLKVFDLSFCLELRVIPPNILSKLTKLEELHLKTFKRWEREELNKERRNASLTELRCLPHLSRLDLCIQDEKIMPKHLFMEELNLEEFNISIGSKEYIPWASRNIPGQMLFLEMESGNGLDGWIKMLLKKCEELGLRGSIGARVLQFFELDENDSSHLKRLYVRNNLQLQHFIHGQNKPLKKILSNLEDLELDNLKNLESIIHGHVRSELPFNKLRIVRARDCNKLRTLFYNCSLDDILNLEKIYISDCEMLEVIAVMESKETIIEFTHLKSLTLDGVPRVRGFLSKIEQTGQSNIQNSEEIETSKISNHASFFNEEVLLPNLQKLKITKADNLKMIWHNVFIHNSFSKLKRVEIVSCNNVEKVFPPNMMSILSCLEFLIIKNCSSLKCIFEVQEPNTTKKSTDLLSNLRRLELCNLPNLEFVWSKDFNELSIFENIEVVSIQGCAKLRIAYPIKVFEQQEDLKIDISRLKEILEKEKSVHPLDSNQFQTLQGPQLQDGMKLFSKLKILDLCGGGSLDYSNSTHLPMEILRIVPNLKSFGVRRMLVEEIFPNERWINVEEQKNTIFELEELSLFDLPKLMHLWKDDCESTSSLQNLKYLEVSRCGILDMLVPSSVSFRNLSSLLLDKCHRLIHLLSPSVGRTLVNLNLLRLEKCKKMTTVIASEVDGEGNDEIVFQKLQYLVLVNLSELTSFHFGKCIIRFPWLERVIIQNCPEMKVFSLGIISTPNLLVNGVSIYDGIIGEYMNGDSNEFVEDINGTIRQFWEDKCDNGIQYLFKEKNLEEDQSDHPSSHVEE